MISTQYGRDLKSGFLFSIKMAFHVDEIHITPPPKKTTTATTATISERHNILSNFEVQTDHQVILLMLLFRRTTQQKFDPSLLKEKKRKDKYLDLIREVKNNLELECDVEINYICWPWPRELWKETGGIEDHRKIKTLQTTVGLLRRALEIWGYLLLLWPQ